MITNDRSARQGISGNCKCLITMNFENFVSPVRFEHEHKFSSYAANAVCLAECDTLINICHLLLLWNIPHSCFVP